MSIFGLGSKVSKGITKTSVKNKAIAEEVSKALQNSIESDKVKVLQAAVEDNKDNPALLKLIADMGDRTPVKGVVNGLKSIDPNNPTLNLLTKAKSYTPPEPKAIRINTDDGVKTFIPRDLSPEDANSVSRLFGEKGLWNRNLGLSAGNVNAYKPDEVIEAYNTAIKKQDILKSLEGNPVNKDAIAKLLYNSAAAASYGSAGNDMAQVVNRFNGNSENGNPDNIWTNPAVVGGAAALTRFAFPLIKQLANVSVNANTLARIADLTVPAAVGKVVNHATTPDPTPSKPWEESAVKTMNKVVGKGNPKPKNNPNNPNNPVIPGNNWGNW